MTTSIKADKEASVGTILDIKEQLRDINALKISFSTSKGTDLSKNY
jgi:biopolymer transport protein ExbD